MKIWLYFQRYQISEDLTYTEDENKHLYAFTMSKDFKKRFECTRYMGAFNRVVMDTKDIPDFETFVHDNRDLKMIELPVQINANDMTTIIGTYKEDSLISDLAEVYSSFMDDLQCKFHELSENGCLTKEAIADVQMLLDYLDNDNTSVDFDIWHMYYKVFIRSFVSPKLWEQLDDEE